MSTDIKRRGKQGWTLVKQAFQQWSDDNATRLAAALAYYTVLSLAPLLVLAIAVAGLVFGEDAARGRIGAELSSLVGAEASEGIETVLTHARSPESGALGTIVGIVVLLFGASGVFSELQSALDAVWHVKPKPGRGVWGEIKDRFLSFSMVLGVAFLLLVSLVLSAALSAAGEYLSSSLPGGAVLWEGLNLVVSIAVITVLFALIFKVIPDVKLTWGDVYPGALFTAALFTIGKFALGLYLGRVAVGSAYGAAGSLIVLVIWVYYAAQILFLGAEFTRAYTAHRGKPLVPRRNAVQEQAPAIPGSQAPSTTRA